MKRREGIKNFLFEQAPFLDVALHPIGKDAKAGL